MISLKPYLDAETVLLEGSLTEDLFAPTAAVLQAYRAALSQMAECGAETCPVHGAELKRKIEKIDASLGRPPSTDEIARAERSIAELLQEWGRKAATHYQQKAG